MIEKMKFLSITGPKTDIDRVVNTYLSKYEIHLENALSELTAVESLSPFMEINPYKEALSTATAPHCPPLARPPGRIQTHSICHPALCARRKPGICPQ